MKNDKQQCDSCQAEFKLGELEDFSSSYPHWDDQLMLCELCKSTFAGNATVYPSQYEQNGKIVQAICFVGNKILKRIDEIEGCD